MPSSTNCVGKVTYSLERAGNNYKMHIYVAKVAKKQYNVAGIACFFAPIIKWISWTDKNLFVCDSHIQEEEYSRVKNALSRERSRGRQLVVYGL